jgi:hypothetical protein
LLLVEQGLLLLLENLVPLEAHIGQLPILRQSLDQPCNRALPHLTPANIDFLKHWRVLDKLNETAEFPVGLIHVYERHLAQIGALMQLC